jgi:hypothetical protein
MGMFPDNKLLMNVSHFTRQNRSIGSATGKTRIQAGEPLLVFWRKQGQAV